MGKAVLIYDADCGFCRWAMDRVRAWDRGHRLRVCALQDPEAEELLGSIDQQRRMASWHLVEEGHVYSAGGAAAPLFRLLPGGRPLATVVETFPGTMERAYSWLARNRELAGRIIGARVCAVRPEDSVIQEEDP